MKRNLDENLDKEIKDYFYSRTENVSVPDDMFFKVRTEIRKKEKGGILNMKIGFFKLKTIAAAAAICILTTATCGAVTNGFSWIGSSSHLTEVYKFPTKDKVESTVGFNPKYVKSFDGGLEFKSFNYSNQDLKSDDGESMTSGKSADFEYKRNGAEKGQYLNFSAYEMDEKYLNLEEKKPNEEISQYKGIEISYTDFKYKAVPEEYEVTDEETKEIEEGTLQVGYGSDEISESHMQSVLWYEDGIQYSILNTNYNDVTKDGMIKMAQDVINS